MHKQKSFPLRIGEQERRRARKLASKMGLSENRLYSNLIQEGLAVLDLAPDVPPAVVDAVSKARRKR
jgi:hypothetical protein